MGCIYQGNAFMHRAGTILLAIICLIVDVFPTYGSPHFRYTGSDPDRLVWNFGWPLAFFIYDDEWGWQVGPAAYLVIPVQFACVPAASS